MRDLAYKGFDTPELRSQIIALNTVVYWNNVTIDSIVLAAEGAMNSGPGCNIIAKGNREITDAGRRYYGGDVNQFQSWNRTIASCGFRSAPMNNCGLMEWTGPHCEYSALSSIWLKIIEAYSRYCGRSVVYCSDRTGGMVDTLITSYGKDYNCSPGYWNKGSYPREPDHLIRLHWKYVGDVDTAPYGFV